MEKRKSRTVSKRNQHASMLTSMGQTFAVFFGYFITLIPLMLIILKGKELGIWWLPLVLVYFALFLFVNWRLIRRKVLDRTHYLLGDELFYKEYPKEYARDQKRKERAKQAAQKAEERRIAKLERGNDH